MRVKFIKRRNTFEVEGDIYLNDNSLNVNYDVKTDRLIIKNFDVLRQKATGGALEDVIFGDTINLLGIEATRNTLINEVTRHGTDSRPYVMDEMHSVNIDSIIDLKLAEALIKYES